MFSKFDPTEMTAIDMRIALDENLPESNYGAMPVIDRYDALEAYLAFEDGTLAEASQALAASVNHQQHGGD
jgi:hypothetical protein